MDKIKKENIIMLTGNCLDKLSDKEFFKVEKDIADILILHNIKGNIQITFK